MDKNNFTLKWHNGNDLDLHVECPCGTHIFYWSRKCKTCKAHLDVDMNAEGAINSINPLENIYVNTVKPGIYKYWVEYYDQHEL